MSTIIPDQILDEMPSKYGIRIYQYVAHNPDHALLPKPAVIAIELKMSTQVVRRELSRLRVHGYVYRIGNKYYKASSQHIQGW